MTVASGVLATAVPLSGNAKLGDAATTHAAQGSCPTDCVFAGGGGCYAETGRQGKFITEPLNAAAKAAQATALDIALAEADAIDAMPVVAGRPMRLHTVGDCASNETAQIVAAAAWRYETRGGGPVWTYTHAWRIVDRSAWGFVSVLASCETAADVKLAKERGYAPAIVVEEFKSDRRYEEDGAEILPCPAQTRHRSCSTCRLCFDDHRLLDRGYAIGFEVHGIPYAMRQARLALNRPDDPLRRMPSEARIRVLREEFLAEGREPTVKEVAEAIDLNPASVYEWLRFLRGETAHPSEVRRDRDARRKAS